MCFLLRLLFVFFGINLMIAESKHRYANLKPKTPLDKMKRNQEKLMVVFNGTCVNSTNNIEQKIQSLLQNYLCLSKWEGIYKNPKFSNLTGIYEDHHGDYHVYFTIDEKKNESLCIDSIVIDHEDHCIDMIDYEVIFKPIGCINNSVYSYPLQTYYRWSLDEIDGVIDNRYTHMDTSSADGNVDIYVLDSGILSSHYEFSVLKSYTLMDLNYSTPETGHGTHVGGIIVGRTCGLTNHNIFDYPVCRGTTDSCYTSYIEDAFNAVISRLSSTKRRGVINMSFGSDGAPSEYYIQWYNNYLSSLVNAGGIPVAAAGNNGQDACSTYPAASPYSFGIGSYNQNYTVSSFSNYGSCVDIYAPGNGIISSWFTSDNSYAIASGTSMAAPVITAIVSDLLWSNNALTYNQILSFLQHSSNNINLITCPSQNYSCKGIKVSCSAMQANTTSNPITTTAKSTTTTGKPTTTTEKQTTTTIKPTTTTAKPTTQHPTTSQPTTLKPTTLKPTITTTKHRFYVTF